MKKIYFITAVVGALVLTACERSPYADFYASDNVIEVNQVVYFTNISDDADYFEWDFGDGTSSNSINPSHAYTYEGTYTVRLTAYRNGNSADEAILTITVVYPTTLEITVLEYYNEYPVSDASVRLYPSLIDWDNETNMVAEGFTDGQGVVTFTGLNPLSYCIDVWHTNHDNYALRNEDVNFIKTLPLVRNQLNVFVAYVDYVEHVSQMSGKKELKMKILKIKRVYSEKQPLPIIADK